MSKFGFIIDNRKCIGCHACTVACKSEHQVPVGVNRTWVKYIEEGTFPLSSRSFSVMRCNHCTDAPCVTMCPVTALFKREDGIVDFDNERCIGCKACTQACPYDALYIDPITTTAAKCNYCSHRVDVGLEPACVVVCPEHAIISGDMENPNSEISQLLASNKTTVRKPEKATQPNVFYIDGNKASLEPTLTDKQSYIWSDQHSGVGYNKDHKIEQHQEQSNQTAKRTYDAPDKGIMWGWEVVSYLITKGIGAGVVFVIATLSMFGYEFSMQDILFAAITGLTFIILTGILLVKDLGRSDRFLYIILRPQFKSWLARGTYIILGFSALLVALIVCSFIELEAAVNIILIISIPSAIITAIYTAFLFAQAKGRAFWNNKMSIFMMLFHSIILGLIALTLILARNIQSEIPMIEIIHVLNILITIILFRGSKVMESKMVADIIMKGNYKMHYWLFAILIGNIIPLILFFTDSTHSISIFYITTALIMVGVIFTNYLFVKIPQTISLS